MRKIAIVARNMSGRTGASTIILNQAEALAAVGWKVTLVSNRISKGLSHPNIRRIIIPRISLGKSFKRLFFSAAAQLVTRLLGFDLIYGHGDSLHQDILALHNCTHKAYEIQHGAHLPESSDVGKFHSRQLREQTFAHLIANSRMMKEDLVNRFGLAADQITILYPGYDPTRFNGGQKSEARLRVRQHWSLPQDAFLIGFLASGDFRNRNLGTLLRTFAGLLESSPQKLHCMVVGSDRHLPKYKALVDDLGISGRVTFAGFQKDTDLYFKAFDVYVHPVHFEAFGMTILEAMACGTPVITTDTAGASELIEGNGRKFVLKQPVCERDLGLLLAEIISSDAKRNELSGLSAEWARDYTWEKNFERLQEVLQIAYKGKGLE